MLLALKLLARDWRSGELRILIAALVIAVAALTSISFYTDRVSRALDAQSAELLGGDLLISSPTTPPATWLEKSAQLKLQSAQVMLFPTVAVAGNHLQLIDIKAVSDHYPLHGQVRTAPNINATDVAMNSIPAPGTVWVDARLLPLLNISINNKIKIGVASFTVARILTSQPDAESNWLNIAAQVMMNSNDIAKTRVVQPGSRIEYRLLFTGNADQLQTFKQWLQPRLTAEQKLLGIKDGRPELKNAVERATSYLHLAVMVCVILVGIAIATCARRYCERHFDTVALLRCFGATQRQVMILFGIHLVTLGIIAAATGCVLGYAAQLVYANIFSFWLKLKLPAVSLMPLLFGLAAGLIILIGFAAPAFLRLKNISTLRMLRRDLLPLQPSILIVYGLPIIAVSGLLFWFMQDLHLTLILLYSTVLAVLALFCMAYLLIKLTSLLRAKTGMNWRYGIANLARNKANSTVQLIAFGLVVMVVLLISIIRNDLLTTWQQQLPHDAPNYFAINIQPNDKDNLTAYLKTQHIQPAGIYPMVRGRLIKLNGIAVKQAVAPQGRNNNALNRELNLSWNNQLPPDNKIVSGPWWSAVEHGKNLVSIEAGLAKNLGIKLGDQLTFQIGDHALTVTVHNIRSVEWSSFHPNFYMIFPAGVIDNLPMTYITSFHVNNGDNAVLVEIIKQFPSVTLIDVAELLKQMRNVIDQLVIAIQYLLVFTLLAGIAVLYAALEASLDARLYEGTIMRVLGAARKQLQSAIAAEFITLGLLAGLFGTICAFIIAYFLALHIFDLEFHFNYGLFLSGIIGGAVVVGALGLLATRLLLKQPPLTTLREI